MVRVQTACVAVTAFLLVACNGVGKGSKPEKLEISKIAGNTVVIDEEPQKSYTCITARLGAVVTFTDGDRGDFSSRAKWTSDAEGVVIVSNYNKPVDERIEAEDGSVYSAGGILYPTGVGHANVTVEYLGFKHTLGVDVAAVTDVRILPEDARIAPDSTQAYSVRAKLDGKETDVTSVTTLSLLDAAGEPASEDIAALVSSGSQIAVSAVKAPETDEPLTVAVKFTAPCAEAPSTTVRVTDIPPGGLTAGYEKNYGNGQIAEGTTEFLSLTATFGDGKTQDLSSQLRAHFDFDRDGDGQCELTEEKSGTTGDATVPACGDTVDNDGDGKIDLEDPGCTSATDEDETDAAPVAFSGILTGLNLMFANIDEDDDDASTLVCASFGADSPARSTTDGVTACADGIDNDEDGDIDLADADCESADDNNEAYPGALSNTIPVAVKDLPLKRFQIRAVDPCVPEDTGCTPLEPLDQDALTIDAGQIIRFLAKGFFGPDGAYIQDVTKDVVWTLSVADPDAKFAPAIVVSGRSAVAGTISTLTSFTGVPGCEDQPTCAITVKATYTRGNSDGTDDLSVTKVLTVKALPEEEAP